MFLCRPQESERLAKKIKLSFSVCPRRTATGTGCLVEGGRRREAWGKHAGIGYQSFAKQDFCKQGIKRLSQISAWSQINARGMFQKAGYVKTQSKLTLRWAKLWVFRSRKRGNWNSRSVTMVTDSMNITCQRAGLLEETLSFYPSLPTSRKLTWIVNSFQIRLISKFN